MKPELNHDTARYCPAILVSASASGQGKTTVTAALARYYRNQGLIVHAFKTGPDFLDPMILEQASQNPVYQLDLWMGGEQHCRERLYHAAGMADIILIEGVMGLFDGQPSSADLAQRLQIPIVAVLDGSAMAQTFAALAHGLASYRADLPFAGVFANRVSSLRHYQLLTQALPTHIKPFGALASRYEISLPERHLGLVQAQELTDLDARITQASQALQYLPIDLPAPVRFDAVSSSAPPPQLAGCTIAIARDAAFSFLYRANVELLAELGARLIYFSPLKDHTLPSCDALYLPGGYPEHHLHTLATNTSMQAAVRDFYAAKRPIYAECGGMLYLAESLTDSQGVEARMTGILPGHAHMQKRLVNIGMQAIVLPFGCLRGHTFHYSSFETPLVPIAHAQSLHESRAGEGMYRLQGLHASYLHLYFPSNPAAAAKLFHPTEDFL